MSWGRKAGVRADKDVCARQRRTLRPQGCELGDFLLLQRYIS